MNRKQRRAALKQKSSTRKEPSASVGNSADQLLIDALRLQRENKFDAAIQVYRRLLTLEPNHAQAYNNLGCMLQAQGKLREASENFAKSLSLMPQLLEQHDGLIATLVAILPTLGQAMQKAQQAWPTRLTAEQLFGVAGFAAIADDPMLLYVIESVPIRQIDLEHVMTALRAELLNLVDREEAISPRVLAFCCTLAKQCFINEYIFALTSEEEGKIARCSATLGEAIKSEAAIAPISIATVAMYRPLYELADGRRLLERTWASPIDDVLTQQLREPLQEFELRASIPRLTPIDDDVSQRVRQQYEENPYPRWMRGFGKAASVTVDAHLRSKFPTAAFLPLGDKEPLDILVPGCGTGYQATMVAQGYKGARVLAVDLSLSSLAYAKRKIPAQLAGRLEYAQGDILKLDSLERRFDLIDVTGVLHHMRDPFEGWRILLSLLRPNGFIHLGLYSELARRDVVAARAFIAERGYASTPADIRRCRQDLLQTPLAALARFADFFSISECRDLLFHVQESRTTIPAIKDFIDAHGLKFIGFDLDDNALHSLGALFADNGWSMSDLGKWHLAESRFPNIFSGMYQLWAQKTSTDMN